MVCLDEDPKAERPRIRGHINPVVIYVDLTDVAIYKTYIVSVSLLFSLLYILTQQQIVIVVYPIFMFLLIRVYLREINNRSFADVFCRDMIKLIPVGYIIDNRYVIAAILLYMIYHRSLLIDQLKKVDLTDSRVLKLVMVMILPSLLPLAKGIF